VSDEGGTATHTVTIEIDAAPADVWTVMSSVEQWPRWTASTTSVRILGGRSLGVGSRVLIRQPRLPPALWRVTKLEEGIGFTWVSRAPGVTVVAGHWIEPVGEGSRVRLSIDYGGLLGGLMWRLLNDVTERYVAMEAEGLRRTSEELKRP
jgi:uncharacterized membrane protein